jgi:hypothetical protein
MSSRPSISQLAFDSAMDSLQSVECLHCIYWPPVTAHINESAGVVVGDGAVGEVSV